MAGIAGSPSPLFMASICTIVTNIVGIQNFTLQYDISQNRVSSHLYCTYTSLYLKVHIALRATMQQISLLLLLLIGLGGAHESHSSDQQILEVVRTETVDDHGGGNNNTHEDDAESSNDAILNALMAFGINDTDLRPGQILCPLSNLGSSYKGNQIIVGAVGCRLDPLISHYTAEQKKALKGHHDDSESLNCTESIDLAGYFPPIPGIIQCLICTGLGHF